MKPPRLSEVLKARTLRWLIAGTVFALFISALVAGSNLRTSTESAAQVEARSMARSFRNDILGGQIKSSEMQIRRALGLKNDETVKILNENLTPVFVESENQIAWPAGVRDGDVVWTGLFDLVAAAPVYFDQQQKSLFGYVAIQRKPAFNWSLLFTIFGSLMAGQFLFAFIHRTSMVRVGNSLSRQLESLTTNLNHEEQIAELAEIRRAFRKASEEISALGKAKNEKTLRRVAHDIRSPLTAFSLGIKSLGEIPLPTRELLEMAYRRMEVIASDILSEKNHITVELFSLKRHFEELLTEKSIEHAPRDVSWAFKFDCPHNSSINVSVSTLMATVSNLLNNAAEASPKAGMIRLEVRSNESILSIAVIDEGPGIALSQQSMILAGGVTSKEGGNGIGLSSAKRFAEAHSGFLTLTNLDFGFEVELILALAGSGAGAEVHHETA